MSAVWHALADPWSQAIMRHAFAEVVLLGVTGGALGCWIVVSNLSYSGESLAHAMLPGLVVAALVGLPLLLGAAAGELVAALAIAVAGRLPTIGRDTAVGVVITTLFGLGVLLALSPAAPPGLQGLLFGDVLGVSDLDLALAAALALVVLAALWLLHGRLLIVGLDRLSARALGVSALQMDVALLVLIAVALVVAVQGLGNLLVVAVLIAPAATARSLTRRMSSMMVLSVVIAIAAGIGGLYLSFYAATAAGASIAAILVAAYAVLAPVAALLRRRAPSRTQSDRVHSRPEVTLSA